MTQFNKSIKNALVAIVFGDYQSHKDGEPPADCIAELLKHDLVKREKPESGSQAKHSKNV